MEIMPPDEWQLRAPFGVPKSYEEAPAPVCHTGRATMKSESERLYYGNQDGMG
jgi:hypothetical protein